MNRLYFLLAAGLISSAAVAQNQYDALKLMNNDLNGTARFVGMGGAMSALGADVSTIGTNPAGIGLFRKSDVSVSFGFNNNKVSSDHGGMKVSDDRTRWSFDQAGFVWASKIGNRTDLRYFNVGFNYTKRANFNRQFSSKMNLNGESLTNQMAMMAMNSGKFGTVNNVNALLDSNNPYTSETYYGVPYLASMGLRCGFNKDGVSAGLLDYVTEANDNTKISNIFGWNGEQGEFYSREEGGINQFDFNVAFNVQDRYYFGLTLGVYDLNYNRYSSYAETMNRITQEGDAEYHDTGDLTLNNWYRADGTGIDLKFGAIVRPFEYSPFRLGFSVHTPIWYSMTDKYTASIASNINIQNTNGGYTSGSSLENLSDYLQPQYVFDYALTTPWRINVSAGTVLGGMVALDAEYEFEKYSSARLRERTEYDYDYVYGGNDLSGTDAIKETLKPVHKFRVGMETNVDGFCIRAGYNFQSAPIETGSFKNIAATDETRTNPEYINPKNRQSFSFGLGYHGKTLYADVAYKYDMYKSDFYAFDSKTFVPAKLDNECHQLLFTVGARF